MKLTKNKYIFIHTFHTENVRATTTLLIICHCRNESITCTLPTVHSSIWPTTSIKPMDKWHRPQWATTTTTATFRIIYHRIRHTTMFSSQHTYQATAIRYTNNSIVRTEETSATAITTIIMSWNCIVRS